MWEEELGGIEESERSGGGERGLGRGLSPPRTYSVIPHEG